jgi:hypothetical protein
MVGEDEMRQSQYEGSTPRHLKRHVGAKPAQSEQHAVYEDGNRHPVLVVGAQEVAQISCAPVGEKVPVVQEEPLAMAEYEEQHESDAENGDEHEQSELSAAISGVGGAGYAGCSRVLLPFDSVRWRYG